MSVATDSSTSTTCEKETTTTRNALVSLARLKRKSANAAVMAASASVSQLVRSHRRVVTGED